MKNIFYHLDCRKTFCHSCEAAEAKIPSCFFYDLYDGIKYKADNEKIYEDSDVNGTSDEKILKTITKYINSDFVIAEGYACKFWLSSEYKNHLLLINPVFTDDDDIDKLFKHPDNIYVIISYEYRHTINDLYEKYLTIERPHTFMYYGAKCEDLDAFYGLTSISRYFITEILAGTEYWRVEHMISNWSPWHRDYYEYGYIPESELMLYYFIPEHHEKYKTILMSRNKLTGIDKALDTYYGMQNCSYMMKYGGQIVRLSKGEKELPWHRPNYSKLKFANEYSEKKFREYEKMHYDYSFPMMLWCMTDLEDNWTGIIECPIYFTPSKADVSKVVDMKMEKYKDILK